MYSTPTFAAGAVTFSDVSFALGETDLTAVATDKAGNIGTLIQPCAVTVGTPPVVTFTAPAAGKNLCASTTTSTSCISDADAVTAGWQGPLTVTVTAGGQPATSGTVTFTVAVGAGAAMTLGTANIVNGVATVASVTIPDGNSVTLTATTSALGANGVGMATRMLAVATTVPAAPTNLQVVVKDRRQTTLTVSWTAPAGAASYDLRYYEAPINPSLFPVAATQVPTTGTPLAAGMTETRDVANLTIQHSYYFAILSKDAAGNSSALAYATPNPAAAGCTTPPCPIQATFNQTIINGPQTPAFAGFGYYLDGSGNFLGDANSDILAGDGYGNNAYIFAGGTTFTATTPAVTFTGPVGSYFGSNIANVGDVDGDGLEDIGIASGYEVPPRIYIYKGRTTTWPTNLTNAQADYTITVDAASPYDANSTLGYPIVKLGDINGDNVGDFAVGAITAGTGGSVLVVFGATPFGGGNLSAMLAASPARAVALTDATASGLFGTGITALGPSNGTLVVSAPTASSSAGRIVSYRWNATTSAFVSTGSYTGPANGQIGEVVNVFGAGVGLISGNGLAGLGSTAYTFLNGTVAMPLTGMPQVFMDSQGQDTFGTVALGGGFSGSNASISYVGDSSPDLVVAGAFESTHQPTVYIIDGDDIPMSTAAVLDAAVLAKAKIALPADWNRSTPYNSPVRDVNGDGYGDFAIGETDATFFATPFRGRAIVFW
jgi:hypothetical protein